MYGRMLRYESRTSTSTKARGSRSASAAARSRRSWACCSSSSSSWSRTMKSTIASSAPPEIRCGWTYPSRSSVVSGESRSCGSEDTSSAASLTAFTSLPFALPGCTERPWIVTRIDFAENVSVSSSPTPEPSSVYATSAPNEARSKSSAPAPHLLVHGEGDPDRRARALGMPEQVRDRGHDLGDAGLVVGAEERRAVARHDVVADPRGELRKLRRVEHLPAVARELDRRAVPALVDERLDAGAHDVGRRVHVRDEPDHGCALDAGEPGEDGGAVVQLRVLEAEVVQLLDEHARQVELLLRARPLRLAVRALRVDLDVAEEPREHIGGELLGEGARERCLGASQAGRAGGRSRAPRRRRAPGTRSGTSRSASARSRPSWRSR